MAMDSQELGFWEWLVEHHVVRTQVFACTCDIDAEAEDLAFVDCIWIGVLDSEGCYSGAEAVEIFAVVGKLCG